MGFALLSEKKNDDFLNYSRFFEDLLCKKVHIDDLTCGDFSDDVLGIGFFSVSTVRPLFEDFLFDDDGADSDLIKWSKTTYNLGYFIFPSNYKFEDICVGLKNNSLYHNSKLLISLSYLNKVSLPERESNYVSGLVKGVLNFFNASFNLKKSNDISSENNNFNLIKKNRELCFMRADSKFNDEVSLNGDEFVHLMYKSDVDKINVVLNKYGRS